MLIELDLNINDAESLLRHCIGYHASSGDCREDSRLLDALDALALALKDAMNAKHQSDGSTEMIDPQLLDTAIRLFGSKTLAIDWVSKPMRALGGKRSLDVDLEEALALMGRLEHGFGA
ncbi:MAG TPA: hypothetical protein VF682_22255 [Pseudomonas sp.]|jgi:hypothetical protein